MTYQHAKDKRTDVVYMFNTASGIKVQKVLLPLLRQISEFEELASDSIDAITGPLTPEAFNAVPGKGRPDWRLNGDGVGCKCIMDQKIIEKNVVDIKVSDLKKHKFFIIAQYGKEFISVVTDDDLNGLEAEINPAWGKRVYRVNLSEQRKVEVPGIMNVWNFLKGYCCEILEGSYEVILHLLKIVDNIFGRVLEDAESLSDIDLLAVMEANREIRNRVSLLYKYKNRFDFEVPYGFSARTIRKLDAVLEGIKELNAPTMLTGILTNTHPIYRA